MNGHLSSLKIVLKKYKYLNKKAAECILILTFNYRVVLSNKCLNMNMSVL